MLSKQPIQTWYPILSTEHHKNIRCPKNPQGNIIIQNLRTLQYTRCHKSQHEGSVDHPIFEPISA